MEGTPEKPSVPAGWYPDPNGEGLRYWDGAAWTTHTAPAAPTAAAATGGTQATAQAADSESPAQSPRTQAPPGAPGEQAPPGAQAKPATSKPAAAASSDEPTTLEWALSIGLGILAPLGLIWGVYLRTQGDTKQNPANVAILLSLAVILIVVLFIL